MVSEASWDQWLFRLRRRRGVFGALSLHPYRTYGTATEVTFCGRLLAARSFRELGADTSSLRNFQEMYRRLHTREVPGATLHVQSGPHAQLIQTDADGYFQVRLPGAREAQQDGWQQAQICLKAAPVALPSEARIEVLASSLLPAPHAHHGIISDIDDTVIVTRADRLLTNLQTTMLGNVRTRMIFPQTAELYQALQGGAANPVFYVSSSPWNLYEFLEDLLDLNGMPRGPMVLRDLTFSGGVSRGRHHNHKLGAIRRILETYPSLPFLLIGDSGQHDVDIYATLAREQPGRILGILIRDVTAGSRRPEIEAMQAGLSVPIYLFSDADHAASLALEHRWIDSTLPPPVSSPSPSSSPHSLLP